MFEKVKREVKLDLIIIFELSLNLKINLNNKYPFHLRQKKIASNKITIINYNYKEISKYCTNKKKKDKKKPKKCCDGAICLFSVHFNISFSCNPLFSLLELIGKLTNNTKFEENAYTSKKLVVNKIFLEFKKKNKP